MSLKHQAPRGTRDLLPETLVLWQRAEAQARGVLERYGYGEIRTPIFEDFELFARTSGDSSDVVKKEMYRFKDLGDRDLALRPEGTASVARAYLEQGLGGRARIHRRHPAIAHDRRSGGPRPDVDRSKSDARPVEGRRAARRGGGLLSDGLLVELER